VGGGGDEGVILLECCFGLLIHGGVDLPLSGWMRVCLRSCSVYQGVAARWLDTPYPRGGGTSG